MALGGLVVIGLIPLCIWLSPYPYRTINHDPPDLQADLSPFANHCTKSSSGWLACGEDDPLYHLGCAYIAGEALLAGLSPNHAVARCIFPVENFTEEQLDGLYDKPFKECLYFDGGLAQMCERIIFHGGYQFAVMKTITELRSEIVPIDSPNEALGFALATTRYKALYGQSVDYSNLYSVNVLEDTHVEETAEGFVVHLFHVQEFGCSPFRTTAIDLKVTRDGLIEELDERVVYREMSLFFVCVD